MSDRIEKSWSDVLSAVHGHHKGLVGEGIVNPERVRLTAEARNESVAKLRADGLSVREIGAVLNEPKSTIHDALKASESGQESSENGRANKTITRALLSQSDQNDWRTPRKYLEAARIPGENAIRLHGDDDR